MATAPRRTMREILDRPHRRGALAVVVAANLSIALRDFNLPAMRNAATSLGPPGATLVALGVIAALIVTSLLIYLLFGAAATLAGRYILGGSGQHRDVRQAVAWGLAPQVWALFFRLLALVTWPEAMAQLQGRNPPIRWGNVQVSTITGAVPLSELLIVVLGELLFLIWYVVVGSATLAEAHGFSTLRGLANLLLAVVLPIVALMVVAAAFALTMWTSG